jgi:hypothetical protein
MTRKIIKMIDKDLIRIKQIGLLLIVAVFSFGLGWWTKDLNDFAIGERDYAVRFNRSKQENPFFLDGKCSEQLTDQIFYSPDNITGGFKSITLQLLKSGQLFLIDSSANLVKTNEANSVYTWTTDTTAIGLWCLRNNNIYLRIQRDEIFLKQTFLTGINIANGMTKTGFPTSLVFSNRLDTIYINRIPCIKQR